MNGKKLIDDVLPDAVSTDFTNIRGSYQEIEDLAINISIQGLINPPTVGFSSSKQKYVVVDGHRRILALRKLQSGEILDENGVPYKLPENYCLQVISRDFDLISSNELRAYRMGANYHQKPPTQQELGSAVLECLNNYSQKNYECLYIEATREQKTDAFDRITDLFKPIPSQRLRTALRVVSKLGSLREDVQEKMSKMMESGRVNSEIVTAIGRLPDAVQEKIIKNIEDDSKTGMTVTQLTNALQSTYSSVIKDEVQDIDKILEIYAQKSEKYRETSQFTINPIPKSWKEQLREMAKERETTISELILSFIEPHLSF